MSRIDDLAREIALLRRDVRNARLEAADAAVSAAQRRHSAKLAVVEEETRRAWRRLEPDTTLLRWRPRAGEAVDVDIGSGLLERLRAADPVADSLGNTDPFIGQTNVLDDPTFEAYTDDFVTLTTSEVTVAQAMYDSGGSVAAWRASQVGATAATCRTLAEFSRWDTSGVNPFNSASIRMDIVASGAGTHEMMIRSASQLGAGAVGPVLPYLVAGVRVVRVEDSIDTNVTSRTLTVELYDVTSAVVRASASIDLTALLGSSGDSLQHRLLCALSLAGQAWEDHTFRLRVRLILVTSGATGSAVYHIGEPQLQMGYSPDLGPFQPIVGLYQPRHLASFFSQFQSSIWRASKYADAQDRFRAYNTGLMQWGSGAATPDVGLSRRAARDLLIDNAGGGSFAALSVNDILPHLAASWVITYNGDGTVATSTRSGAAGSASTTVTYTGGGEVASIVSVRAGRTVTVTPTYTAGKITSLTRAVV